MDRKVFYNGTILTMQAEGHTVEAVYTIGDRIAAIGNRDDVFRQITDDTERVDLEGKTLIPGFIESHAHGHRLGGMRISPVHLLPYQEHRRASGHDPRERQDQEGGRMGHRVRL